MSYHDKKKHQAITFSDNVLMIGMTISTST